MVAILCSFLKAQQKRYKLFSYLSFLFFTLTLCTILIYPALDGSLIDPHYYKLPGSEDFKVGEQLFNQGEWEEASRYFIQASQNAYRPRFNPDLFDGICYSVDGPSNSTIRHITRTKYLRRVYNEIRWNIYRHSQFCLGFMHLNWQAFDKARFYFDQAVSFNFESAQHNEYFNYVNFIDPFWYLYASLMYLSLNELETAYDFTYLADEVAGHFTFARFDDDYFWDDDYDYYWEKLEDDIGNLLAKADVAVLSLQSLIYHAKNNLSLALEMAIQAIKRENWLKPYSQDRRSYYLATLYINRGALYEENRQMQNALQDYTEAIQIAPLRADAYLHRAKLYDTLKNYELALQDYHQVIRLDPHCPDWYKERAVMYRFNHNRDLAKADLKMAQAIEIREIREALGQGLTSFSKSDYQKSIQHFTKLMDAYPNEVIGYQNRAAACYQAGLFEQALVDINQALSLTSNDSCLYEMQGLIHLSLAHLETAEQSFLKAVQLDSKQADFYQNLATVYYLQGALDEALNYYQKVVNLLGKKDDQLLLNIAVIYWEKKDFIHALHYCTEALKLNSSSAISHLVSALCLQEQGEYEKALIHYQSAITLGCGHSSVYLHRGQAYYGLGLKEQALADLTTALALNPTSLALYQMRGWLLFELNRPDEFYAHFLNTLPLLCNQYASHGPFDQLQAFQKGLLSSLIENKIEDVKALNPLLLHLLLDPHSICLKILKQLDLKMLDVASQGDEIQQELPSEFKELYLIWNTQQHEHKGYLVGCLMAHQGIQSLHEMDLQAFQINDLCKKINFEQLPKMTCDLKYRKPILAEFSESVELPKLIPDAIPVYPENSWVMPYAQGKLIGLNIYPEYSIPCIAPKTDHYPLASLLLTSEDREKQTCLKSDKKATSCLGDDVDKYKIFPSVMNLQMTHLRDSQIDSLICR